MHYLPCGPQRGARQTLRSSYGGAHDAKPSSRLQHGSMEGDLATSAALALFAAFFMVQAGIAKGRLVRRPKRRCPSCRRLLDNDRLCECTSRP